jgi:hypothetical protein
MPLWNRTCTAIHKKQMTSSESSLDMQDNGPIYHAPLGLFFNCRFKPQPLQHLFLGGDPDFFLDL